MPCQVGPVPFRKVNYLAPVGLPNIGGHVQLFIYAHSGKCLLFLLHFRDFFLSSICCCHGAPRSVHIPEKDPTLFSAFAAR